MTTTLTGPDDTALFTAIIAALNAGLADMGVEGVSVKQAYQPTNQGVDTGPMITVFKMDGRRYGWTDKKDRWDKDAAGGEGDMVHTETQVFAYPFRIGALQRKTPGAVGRTASDLVAIASMIMASDATIQSLVAAGIGIQRITDVRNPYFMDDQNRFEASPSFDFTLTYEKAIISSSPVVEIFEANIQRV